MVAMPWKAPYAAGRNERQGGLSIRREVAVPLAERPERLPERLLGRLVVERLVDVRHVEEVARRRELLDLAGLRLDRPAERDVEVVQLAKRVVAHRHDDPRLHDRQLL